MSMRLNQRNRAFWQDCSVTAGQIRIESPAILRWGYTSAVISGWRRARDGDRAFIGRTVVFACWPHISRSDLRIYYVWKVLKRSEPTLSIANFVRRRNAFARV